MKKHKFLSRFKRAASYKKEILAILQNSGSNLIIITGIFTAIILIFLIDNWKVTSDFDPSEFPGVKTPPAARHGELTAEEMVWAKNAWQYFEKNYQPTTGLINSADKFEVVTMWEVGSYFMALVSAYKLGIIDEDLLHKRLTKALDSLNKLPLFIGKLPNKAYNSKTLKMVSSSDPLKEVAVGWSALDIARLMTSLYYVAWSFPEYAESIKAIIKKWNLSYITKKGELQGAHYIDGHIELTQEGRLGYEEYASKGLQLFGVDATKSFQTEAYLGFKHISKIDVPIDTRSIEVHKAHNSIVSEPFILDGLEFGWDSYSRNLAYRVYKAQEERFRKTGIYTAVSEDNLDQAPHFVYNSVFTDGKEWHAITENGLDADKYKTLSTKASIGWYVLYDTDYTADLAKQVSITSTLNGWFAGIYESNHNINAIITANTNAIILEALYFKKFGSLISGLYTQDKRNAIK